MKPEEPEAESPENPAPINGDVIGDTAYSERFVLKILLKFANLDTLKDEIQEKSFEDDLCTLWDMTAERDVVLFLQKHDALCLFNFALPNIEFPRLIEIIVGIVANMSCLKEVVTVLLEMDNFLAFLLEYIKCDDSSILIQVLRLINSNLFLTDEDDISKWIEVLFENVQYSTSLYFILKNSSNKDLLITALENFNTICSYCNVKKYRTKFFSHFVTPEALDSLTAAFTEITVNQNELCKQDELERILVISLQITLNLVGFDKSLEMYNQSKENVITMIQYTLIYYENKLVSQKEIDTDLIDVIESTNDILNSLQISHLCDPDYYFAQSYNMWKALRLIMKYDQNGSSNFEEDDKEELQDFSKRMQKPLSTLICTYLQKCPDGDLLKALDEIGEDYEAIVDSVADNDVQQTLAKRTVNYRTRLKDNVDS